ncbi:MAG: EVE domain-containing protein [Cyclobacteriaceae bacterium]|nr:EVE domain-containing protein [Cyclobacteriaceae bacterium]
MNYWLVKTEPETYGWNDLVKLGRDHWDGVRNYQARNHMKEMKVGDEVLFYHSGVEKQIVGLAKVVKEWFADPGSEDDRWVAVEVEAVKKLSKPIGLTDIKKDGRLEGLALIKNSRLSVMPVSLKHFEILMDMSK